ncbi:hypothetical protein BJ508DRAFT_72358 [Ascobolus immersus RN42]|uniref:BTB domain-containing protein n=1 Tax=Ascobolus immersus RN42 TaxID=1160509 RepID=A0A3N4HGA3_ASCIM|nr:hypothetical protein BJ508DRAFT_72358 [Ascobolus immersus RN42]
MSERNTRNTKKRGLPSDRNDANGSKRSAPVRAYNSLLQGSYLGAFKEGRMSDLVLVCEGETFNVHKYPLSLQSEFFAGCLESGMRESVEGRIELKEENLEDVKRMLEYMYSGVFWEHDLAMDRETYGIYDSFVNPETERSEQEKSADPLIVCMRMYAVADKFGIPGLKEEVRRKVREYTKRRLPTIEYSRELTLWARTQHVHREWHRLMDALEFCFAELGGLSDVNELADILLQPLATVAPNLLDPIRREFYQNVPVYDNFALFTKMEERLEQENPHFDDLQRRLERNAQFASRLFRLTCLQSLRRDREFEFDRELMKRKDHNDDLKRMLKILAYILEDPERIRALQCEATEDFRSGDDCSDAVLVPEFAERCDGETLAFTCTGCGWEKRIEELQSDFGLVEL